MMIIKTIEILIKEYISKFGDWMVPGQDTDPDGLIYVNGWPPGAANSNSGSSSSTGMTKMPNNANF